jgi:putative nucleotidyltransferase with HDIG domain
VEATPGQFAIVDIDLKDGAHLPALRDWLSRGPKNHKVVFVASRNSRIEEVRAFATGATDLICRPIDVKALLVKFWGDFTSLTEDQTEFAEEKSAGVTAAHSALQSIFSCACLGEQLNLKSVDEASAEVVDQIESGGLANWVEAVRKHHSQTYQHSLLVTGVAVTFGQNLGFSAEDRQRLAFAGMMHDIGKARVPVAILEKPGRLDADEMAVMRQHPEFGFDALRSVPGLDPKMIDMVVHHHEYLDGSGYPHGLTSSGISDFVRVMTISDVFGALIERRSYKPPLSSEAAYKILLDMGPKLDKDLVREFGFMSRLNARAA